MLDRIFTQLLTADAVRSRPQTVLDAFEQLPGATPTHWSTDAFLRDPYDRGAVEKFVSDVREKRTSSLLYLRRLAQPTRYLATVAVRDEYPSFVTIQSDLALGPNDPGRFTLLGTQLASSLLVEFGLVSFDFEPIAKEDRMKPSGYEHAPTFSEVGPATLWPRTFIGKKVGERLGGMEALSHAGLLVARLSNGVLAADLLPEPWTKAPHDLKLAQTAALERLRGARVFGSV